jgi:hypothetical protein
MYFFFFFNAKYFFYFARADKNSREVEVTFREDQ